MLYFLTFHPKISLIFSQPISGQDSSRCAEGMEGKRGNGGKKGKNGKSGKSWNFADLGGGQGTRCLEGMDESFGKNGKSGKFCKDDTILVESEDSFFDRKTK